MPDTTPRLRGAHDLFLVCGVALVMIGLGAVAAGLVNHEMARPAILTTAPGASESIGGATHPEFDWRACTCGWRGVVPRTPAARIPGQDVATSGTQLPGEPAARRTYLLGSSAVAHGNVWVHDYVATPPAAELQALASGSWQP